MLGGRKLRFRSPTGRVSGPEPRPQPTPDQLKTAGSQIRYSAAAHRIGLRMAVFFTSDTHFGHAGARGFYRRPFASVAAMDATMLDRWNTTVGPEDEVWHLGDFALGVPEIRMAELLGRLRGRKHLVTGNNDTPATTSLAGWSSVQPYAEIELDGLGLVLCHYPFRTWRNMSRGWLNLHGHSHGRLAPLLRQADIGVDVWDFRPVKLEQITATKRTRMRIAPA